MKTEWAYDRHYVCPASLTPGQVAQLQQLTAAVFRVTGCLDVARVDFRLDVPATATGPISLRSTRCPACTPG